MKVEIGKAYRETIDYAISLYNQGKFNAGKISDASCYYCIKGINQEGIELIASQEINGKEQEDTLRFHKDCMEFISLMKKSKIEFLVKDS